MQNVLNYSALPGVSTTPAQLKHNTNGWYIEYYAFSPSSQRLRRRRFRLNRISKCYPNMMEFRFRADEIVHNINSQLTCGWNPFVSDIDEQTLLFMPQARSRYVYEPEVQPVIDKCVVKNERTRVEKPKVEVQKPIETPSTIDEEIDLLQVPLTIVEDQIEEPEKIYPAPELTFKPNEDNPLISKATKEFARAKKPEVKKATYHSYESITRMFGDWVAEVYPDATMQQLDQRLAVKYLDHVYLDKKVANRTYNNNVKTLRVFAEWAIEKCYLKENPFQKIKIKRLGKKQRSIIPQPVIKSILNYFQRNNPSMALIMHLVYTSLLRPVEVSRVQVKDIRFNEKCILMPGEKTKNSKPRPARISPELEELLRNHVQGANPEDYLFGDKSWRCGAVAMSSHTFCGAWGAMRKELELGKEYQLYSLRDTSINSMLKAGVASIDVMQAAGHSDLEMTTQYGDHEDPELMDRLNQKAPKLGEQFKVIVENVEDIVIDEEDDDEEEE